MKNDLRIQNKRRDRPLSKDISQLAEFINLTVKDIVITHGLYIVDDDGHVAHALLLGWKGMRPLWIFYDSQPSLSLLLVILYLYLCEQPGQKFVLQSVNGGEWAKGYWFFPTRVKIRATSQAKNALATIR